MKWASHVLSLGVMLALTSVRLTAGSTVEPASVPTFAKDVAPILFAGCVTCHRPSEVAPMSLLSYEEARPWAKAIKAKVLSREMPPWHADPRYGKFRNDRSLTPDQIATIVAWVDGGAPKGLDANLPSPPVFAGGWRNGSEPDYVVEIPEYHVEAEGEVPYLNFWAPVSLKEDRFAEVLEVRPSNPRVVHHASLFQSSLPEGSRVIEGGLLILADGTAENALRERCPVASCQTDQELKSSVQSESPDRKSLVNYLPGEPLHRYLPGTGKRIYAGRYIVFGNHYQASGRPETDRMKLGIWFSNAVDPHEVYTSSAGNPIGKTRGQHQASFFRVEGSVETHGPRERGFPVIPPYAENYKVMGITAVSEPITLSGFSPHMHLRGKDITWSLTWPDGREEVLLSVPKYDFNWQIQYDLKEPLRVPAGSTITGIAHYDNSLKNKYNPSPANEVYWGEQSWDEMFSPLIEYTIDSEAPGKKKTKSTQQQ